MGLIRRIWTTARSGVNGRQAIATTFQALIANVGVKEIKLATARDRNLRPITKDEPDDDNKNEEDKLENKAPGNRRRKGL